MTFKPGLQKEECPKCEEEIFADYEHLGDGGQDVCPECGYIIRVY